MARHSTSTQTFYHLCHTPYRRIQMNRFTRGKKKNNKVHLRAEPPSTRTVYISQSCFFSFS